MAAVVDTLADLEERQATYRVTNTRPMLDMDRIRERQAELYTQSLTDVRSDDPTTRADAIHAMSDEMHDAFFQHIADALLNPHNEIDHTRLALAHLKRNLEGLARYREIEESQR